MKKIAILVPKCAVIQAIADPQYCFSAANEFSLREGKFPLFEIHLVGEDHAVQSANGLFTVHCDKLIGEGFRYDLVIIPALFGDLQSALYENAALIEWLKMEYYKGTELASLCLGAYLLAATGLLDGKACSTHWGFSDDLQSKHPEINVRHGMVVTEENGIYTSGGANSYWNLLLHLVEKFGDRSLAIKLSKYFAVDYGRQDQSVFSIFSGLRSHGDDVILKAQSLIESDVRASISIETLSDQLAVGRRSFERRFRQATHHSALEYIQRVKVESAKRQIETSSKSISEIMLSTGYNDLKAFRTVFKKWTGITPQEYREKYGVRSKMLNVNQII